MRPTQFVTRMAAQSLVWAAIAFLAALFIVWASTPTVTPPFTLGFLALVGVVTFTVRFVWLLIDALVAAFANANEVVRRGLEGDE